MTPEVYLASSSPRRKELLGQLGLQFSVIHPQVDERRSALELPEHYVARLAMDKARTGQQLLLDDKASIQKLVIGADTCIVIGDEVVCKPNNKQHFLQLMAKLSGNTHQVYSAVAIACNTIASNSVSINKPLPKFLENSSQEKCLVNCTSVQFREISLQEREWYWQTGEPLDKAGGYAIQGLAAVFIKNINGSYSGVVGLPLFETVELLSDFGINILR